MKYIGSKAKFADEIVAILQKYISAYKIKQYVEPFVGGFNVIDKITCENRLGNDIDPLVCELVEACRETPNFSTFYIRRPVRNITTSAIMRTSLKNGIAPLSCFLRHTMPAFMAGATVRQQPRKTAKCVTISRKAKRISDVNYRCCEISSSGVAIIGICDFRRGSEC